MSRNIKIFSRGFKIAMKDYREPESMSDNPAGIWNVQFQCTKGLELMGTDEMGESVFHQIG